MNDRCSNRRVYILATRKLAQMDKPCPAMESAIADAVAMAEQVIRLRPENSKTREGRILALEGELWNVLAEQGAAREYDNRDETIGVSRYVFHHNGEPIGDIRESWDAACKQAQIKGKIVRKCCEAHRSAGIDEAARCLPGPESCS